MAMTVAEQLRHVAEPVKGSRFIVDVTPVSSEKDAHDVLASVRRELADATHHCSAWRLASPAIDRASDDGEPSGSAGRPILAQLSGRELVDVAMIVTRYFGGTKLGVGGLVRAYGGSAAAALDRARVVKWAAMTEITFDHQYAANDAIERAIASSGAVTIKDQFGEQVTRVVRVSVDDISRLALAISDATAGEVQILCPRSN